MKQNNREVVYWSTQEDDDMLCESDIDQVVQDYLDQYELSEGETELTVYGFTCVEPYIKKGFSIERLIEALDDDFGDPDENTEITQTMKDAEEVFHNSVLSEYRSWYCEVVEKRTINIAQWCKDNNYEIET
jgi:hypothetical protein